MRPRLCRPASQLGWRRRQSRHREGELEKAALGAEPSRGPMGPQKEPPPRPPPGPPAAPRPASPRLASPALCPLRLRLRRRRQRLGAAHPPGPGRSGDGGGSVRRWVARSLGRRWRRPPDRDHPGPVRPGPDPSRATAAAAAERGAAHNALRRQHQHQP
ncbi:unnamed protein product [Rangifer tarandus platyrhynchus]|uniref:Uncharacterized protein n=2 Tax=Rangifer tarandus platyrhynchus TaxID=3082113 RepID=A0ABN8Z746_RANTA|nr:unnamed protein product [Rangifer tarandus platyrhynchus]CAI9704581.1 unnamed protein product [Rangifer tarandus platyrhynchus]